MEKLIQELLKKLNDTYGADLVSVILYGSGVSSAELTRYSDLNIFCVLRQISVRELAASEPIFRWWREKGSPAPLLMGVDEVHGSTDCFPIEFHDMGERRRVLQGDDVIASLQIDDVHYRIQVEHECRAKLLRLRQKATSVLSDPDLLVRLMADSVSTFCVLARHALRLAAQPSPFPKREIVASFSTHLGVSLASFDTLLDLRDGRTKPKDVRPQELFELYLRDIQSLVAVVDRISR